MPPLRSRLTNRWFFSQSPWWLRFLFVYVWGDALVLVPLALTLCALIMIDMKVGLITLCAYATIRGMGEIMYWFHHQFGERSYRPADFGLKELDNNAIYILYQLLATAQTVIAIACLAFVILRVH